MARRGEERGRRRTTARLGSHTEQRRGRAENRGHSQQRCARASSLQQRMVVVVLACLRERAPVGQRGTRRPASVLQTRHAHAHADADAATGATRTPSANAHARTNDRRSETRLILSPCRPRCIVSRASPTSALCAALPPRRDSQSSVRRRWRQLPPRVSTHAPHTRSPPLRRVLVGHSHSRPHRPMRTSCNGRTSTQPDSRSGPRRRTHATSEQTHVDNRPHSMDLLRLKRVYL